MAEVITFDFGYPAAPGDGWPPIMGSPGSEVAGAPTVPAEADSYVLAYIWEVD